jgi:hypothetical protein
MRIRNAAPAAAVLALALGLPLTMPVAAQTPPKPEAEQNSAVPAPDKAAKPGENTEPKTDRTYFTDRKASELLAAVDSLLKRAAEERAELKNLPSRENYVIPPIWQETREDRDKQVRALLDSVFEIVTDAPVVEMQTKLYNHRKTISDLRDRITALREKRLRAPEESLLPSILSDTQSSIDEQIADLNARITLNEEEIAKVKAEI